MKTDYQWQIILRLKQLREKQGISQGTLAAILGISPGQIGNIESPKQPHKYTLKQLVRICLELETTLEAVLSLHGKELSKAELIDMIIDYQNNN